MTWRLPNGPPKNFTISTATPHQLENVVGQTDYVEAKKKLAEQLLAELNATRDPRIIGAGDEFDDFPYRRRVRGSGGLP
jgi:hypothetical protein